MKTISFIQTYDAGGNQTRIKTATGIWNVTYNAENRPIRFEREGDASVIECTYDYMGRRHTRKIIVNASISSYLRYIYRGYLQIAAIDAVSGVFRWFLVWDPTQPTATRPLAIRKDSTWYAYGWDLTKNVTEIFGKAGYLRTAYTYTPYGTATANGDVTQPLTWSSEYNDEELALIYYNYRHYNPTDGRWINRDPIEEQGGVNLYAFVRNKVVRFFDERGLLTVGIDGTNYDTTKHENQRSNVSRFINEVNDDTLYFGGPGSNNTSIYWPSDLTGTACSKKEKGFGEVRDVVHSAVCAKYAKNKNIIINFVGWSRGAVIAVEVAKLLNEKGCRIWSSKRSSAFMYSLIKRRITLRWHCYWKKPVPVNFIGLFDPVDMSFFNWNTSVKPQNVNVIYSIQSDSRAVKEQLLFPPQRYEGEERIKVKRNHDQSRTKHGDIGGTESSRTNDAYDKMKKKAIDSGLSFK